MGLLDAKLEKSIKELTGLHKQLDRQREFVEQADVLL